jgi:hypothetical protein
MAATGTVYIAISCQSRTGTDLAQKLAAPADEPHNGINHLAAFLERVLGGTEPARVYCAIDNPSGGTAGTATIACTVANYTAGETLTINGVVFTIAAAYSSDPSTALTQLIGGASDTAAGAELVTKIHNHPRLKGMYTAVNAAGTVTITTKDKGLFGNLSVLAETGDAFVVTQVTNGAEGTLAASLRVYDKS